MRQGLAEFFNAYRMLLRNQQSSSDPSHHPAANILQMEVKTGTGQCLSSLDRGSTRRNVQHRRRHPPARSLLLFRSARPGRRAELMTALVYVIFSKVYRDIADESSAALRSDSFWMRLIATSPTGFFLLDFPHGPNGRHWNIMLDLITQSLADLTIRPSHGQGHHHQSQAGILLCRPEGHRNLFTQAGDDRLPHRAVPRLDPSQHEALYWSAGGLRRILRPVRSLHLLAGHDGRLGTEMKRLMKRLHHGNVRNAIEDLVRLTGHCRTTEERLAVLEPYLEEVHKVYEETAAYRLLHCAWEPLKETTHSESKWRSQNNCRSLAVQKQPKSDTVRRRQPMKRLIATASLTAALFLFGLAGQAQAFIFTDLVAKVQRLAMMAQVAEQIQKIDDYRKSSTSTTYSSTGTSSTSGAFTADCPPGTGGTSRRLSGHG